jgi:hypothetical protein
MRQTKCQIRDESATEDQDCDNLLAGQAYHIPLEVVIDDWRALIEMIIGEEKQSTCPSVTLPSIFCVHYPEIEPWPLVRSQHFTVSLKWYGMYGSFKNILE